MKTKSILPLLFLLISCLSVQQKETNNTEIIEDLLTGISEIIYGSRNGMLKDMLDIVMENYHKNNLVIKAKDGIPGGEMTLSGIAAFSFDKKPGSFPQTITIDSRFLELYPDNKSLIMAVIVELCEERGYRLTKFESILLESLKEDNLANASVIFLKVNNQLIWNIISWKNLFKNGEATVEEIFSYILFYGNRLMEEWQKCRNGILLKIIPLK